MEITVLMPTLSVTAIGVVGGLVLMVVGRLPSHSLLWSVAGAWAGFLLGAAIGGIVDVVAHSGEGVLIGGHLLAAVGAVIAPGRLRTPAARSS